MQVLHAIQVLISSNLPSMAFFGNSGSARRPLPMQIRSAIPFFIISSAIRGSLILPTAITGTSSASLIFPAKPARQAFSINMGWQIHSGVASFPAETWTTSMPAFWRIFRISILSSMSRPSLTNSMALILKEMGKSLPMRCLTSRTISSANLVLPAISPPYRSSRILENFERN